MFLFTASTERRRSPENRKIPRPAENAGPSPAPAVEPAELLRRFQEEAQLKMQQLQEEQRRQFEEMMKHLGSGQ